MKAGAYGERELQKATAGTKQATVMSILQIK